MKIIFFLGHPAHFHLFKNIIVILKNRHKLLVLIKEKDILEELIRNEKLEYHNIQPVANRRRRKNKFSILTSSAYDLLIRDLKLLRIVRKFRPDLMIGSEASIAHVGCLTSTPSVITNEDDLSVQPEFCYPTFPFASNILSPTPCDLGRWNKKKIGYEGYHKLAYLHPNYFKPSIDKISQFHTGTGPYFILRFVSLTASHDLYARGITAEVALNIVQILEPFGKVYITSEKELDSRFQPYRLNIIPNDIHHALYFAQMLISDSQSMSVEASMLGTPSIRFSDFAGRISVLDELEHRYKLTFGIKTSDPEKLYEKIRELLSRNDLKQEWRRRKEKMLSEKIDVTAFFVWFIENYPHSTVVLREDPEYQLRFR